MQPVLFEIPILGLPIRGFGVMAMLSFIGGLSYILWRSRGKELPAPFLMDLSIICLISGILGARIFFVFENFDQFNWTLFHVWDGGFSISGAVLGFVLPFMGYFGWNALLETDRANAGDSTEAEDESDAKPPHGNPRSQGADSTRLYWLIGLGIVFALLFARGVYVYMHPESYVMNIQVRDYVRKVYPFDFLKIWQGGIVFYGGLFGGIIGGGSFIKWHGYSVLNIADIFAAPLLLAQVIARWGCFLVGDDFGTRVSESFPLAVRFPEEAFVTSFHKSAGIIDSGADLSAPVHPAQLYMSAGVFIALLLLLGIEYLSKRLSGSKTPVQGWSFGWMLILYSIHRFTVEFFRGDPVAVFSFSPIPTLMNTFGLPPVYVNGGVGDGLYALRISQLISVGLALGAAVFMLYCWWSQRKNNEPRT